MSRARILLDAALLIFVAILVACYAAALNEIFYARFGPFYDSMAYLNESARMMGVTAQEGFFAAVRLSTSAATVFLPFAEAAVLGSFLQPSRWLGVLIQLPWLIVYVLSGYCYFRRVSKLPSVTAICFAISLISFAAMFFANGGLSDFRMDLLQALTFGASIATYLVARERPSPMHWIGLGTLLGASCLCRATTPVYIVMVFAPFAVADVLDVRRRKLASGLLLAAFAAIVVSGWFFVLNFGRLYHYYIVWNPDANAHLPLRDSYRHINFVRDGVGWPIGLTLLLSMAANVALNSGRLASLNWRALWAGLAPLAYLVLSGAGLNPFVSMVAIPGIMLFALAPFTPSEGHAGGGQFHNHLVAGAALMASALSLSGGIANHKYTVSEWVPRNKAMREVNRLIMENAESPDQRALTLTAAYSGALDATAIANSLIFDEGFKVDRHWCLSRNAIKLSPVRLGLSSQTEWNAFAGASDQEKIASLAQQILSSADFIVLVDDSTPPIAHPHTPVNRYTKELGNIILSHDGIRPLGAPISISPIEKVNIYRNQTRLPNVGGAC